ncbi:MAG: hypothetical protein ACO28M_01910 [Vulcanococcus sp.]
MGTYTLGNGSTTPALVVRDPGESVVAGTDVSGLEVVISSVPELDQQLQYTSSPFIQTWNVFLMDWGGGDLEGAAAVVQSGFPGTTATILAVTEGIGPKRQTQLRIPLDRAGGAFAFQVPPTLQVQSVNGQTGNVSLGLADLDDVDSSGLTNNSVLVWDAASSSWKVNVHTTLTLTDGGHW